MFPLQNLARKELKKCDTVPWDMWHGMMYHTGFSHVGSTLLSFPVHDILDVLLPPDLGAGLLRNIHIKILLINKDF